MAIAKPTIEDEPAAGKPQVEESAPRADRTSDIADSKETPVRCLVVRGVPCEVVREGSDALHQNCVWVINTKGHGQKVILRAKEPAVFVEVVPHRVDGQFTAFTKRERANALLKAIEVAS